MTDGQSGGSHQVAGAQTHDLNLVEQIGYLILGLVGASVTILVALGFTVLVVWLITLL